MTTRTDKRMQALGDILSGGLSYSWFRVEKLNVDKVTAVVWTDDEDEDTFDHRHEIGPDDVARGLRMYREWLEGKREAYKGEWKWCIKDALRAGVISDESEFDPAIHARADKGSYGWGTVLFDRTNGDEGDYDANTADSVMQFAVLGEAIFG